MNLNTIVVFDISVLPILRNQSYIDSLIDNLLNDPSKVVPIISGIQAFGNDFEDIERVVTIDAFYDSFDDIRRQEDISKFSWLDLFYMQRKIWCSPNSKNVNGKNLIVSDNFYPSKNFIKDYVSKVYFEFSLYAWNLLSISTKVRLYQVFPKQFIEYNYGRRRTEPIDCDGQLSNSILELQQMNFFNKICNSGKFY